MSHPLYNPYATGNQSSTQGQYGLPSIQAERDPQRTSGVGPASSFSSSGASSAIPGSSGGMLPSLMSQSMSYRPEQSRAIMDEDIKRSIDMHISRAREEVRALNQQMHLLIDQDSRFTSSQRDEFCSVGTGMASYPVPSTSASLEHRPLDVESGGSSLDWFSNYKRPTADDSKFYSSSVSSNYASGGDGMFNSPSGRDHDMQSIPGLGDYENPMQDKPAAPTESSQPKYTSESAANILQQFGLEKEDLDYLISFPEDQITPDNLPFILRQIRIHKARSSTTAVQSKPYPEPQPTRSTSGIDSHSWSSSGGGGMRQEGMSSAVLQPSKVIDYGHTGKYTGGVGEDIGSTSGSRARSGGSGSMFLTDSCDNRHSQEPLQKNTTEMKCSALGSRSVTSPSTSYSSAQKSVAHPRHDQTKRMKTQPNQTSQTIPSSFFVPKKDSDIRVLKSEASRPVPLKEPEADRQSTLKTQPTASVLRDVCPRQPGLVLLGSDVNSSAKDQSKTRVRGSTAAERVKKQQTHKQMQKQPSSHTEQAMWPQVSSGAKSFPPAAFNPGMTDASRALQHSAFIPGDPAPIVLPPALSQPTPAPMSFSRMTKVTASKDLPTLAMMHDYAAAPPRSFPHTCSLCHKECTHMKDWIFHQNTSLHIESCRQLQKQYPQWDGGIAVGPRPAGKDAKPSPSTSAQTSQHRHQKTSSGSRSRSCSSSPHRYHVSERRREKRSNRSRSPHSSGYTRRSSSRSCSPWYDRPSSSHYRSCSGSSERLSSPRKNDKRRSSPRKSPARWSPPRRSDKRLSSPRRSCETRSPQWMSDERLSSPRRSHERQSPPRRSREKLSSTEGSSSQQRKPSNAERLAKKRLDTSAVQSLSRQSDLEAVVKTLAPALLAELMKMKSSSSSSSSSTAKKKELKESKASSSTKTKVATAGKQFGNIKPLVLVPFREEQAGTRNRVQQRPLKKKPATSSFSTPQAGTFTATTSPRKVLLPTPNRPPLNVPSLPSGARKATTGKRTNLTVAAKDSLKGVRAVTKAKVLVSKAKNVTSKQITRAAKKRARVSQMQPAGSSAGAAVDAKLPAGGLKRRDLVTAVKTQTNTASAKVASVSSEQTAAAVSKQQQTVNTLFAGDMVAMHLHPNRIACHDPEACLTPKFLEFGSKQLLITGLPKFSDHCYTEEDVAKLLMPFGFQYRDDTIYVIPQTRMAFAVMPSSKTAQNVIKVSTDNGIFFKGSKLCLRVITRDIAETRFNFYAALMELMNSPVKDSGLKTVFIKNISPSEVRDLREVLKKIGSVRDYLPLLNKVFIEFESVHDADRLGVWYSLLKQPPGYEIHRLRIPHSCYIKSPQLPEKALPDSKDAVAGATVLPLKQSVPWGSRGPHWITMRTSPFLFPVLSQWITHPVSVKMDIEEARVHGSRFTTVMVMGLPGENYRHDDVAKLVWDYVPKQNLHSLYYNVMVLPLQRRAFVHFADWTTCFDFVRDKIADEVWMNGSRLRFHFVLDHMKLLSSEEMMFKTLMKLSNVVVQEPESLEERLLCVQISEVSLDVIRTVMEAVSSIATFVNVLPLANRICFEMADSSSVTQVLEKHKTFSPDSPGKLLAWSRVGRFETPKSLKQRLQDAGENVELDNVWVKPPAGNAAGQSASFTSNIAMEDDPMKTQRDAASATDASDASQPTAAGASEQLPAASTPSSTARPTTEEMIEKHLDLMKIADCKLTKCSPKSYNNSQLIIIRLPPFRDGSYTEEEVAKLLMPFGFQYDDDSIYIVPQKPMAFIRMPTSDSLCKLLRVRKHFFLKGTRVRLHPSTCCFGKTPIGFYKSLMNLLKSPVEDNEPRIVFITNISPSETRDLREALKKSFACSVRHFLPLVNKVFIEFESVHDADQFGVWYGRLERAPGCEVYRLRGRGRKRLSTASTPPLTAVTPELEETHLDQDRIVGAMCFSSKGNKKLLTLGKKQLLITGLPSFYDGCYTEEDIAKLLMPFGFQYQNDTIYVAPQAGMAFIKMPTQENVQNIIHISTTSGIYFQESRLCFRKVIQGITMRPFWFLKSLKSLMNSPVEKDGWKTVFITNISPSEVRDLREALKKIGSVRDYLPLLNKVLIEFETVSDADRIGVWFSLLKKAPGYEVHRRLYGLCDSIPPRLPENVLPDSDDAVAGATVPKNMSIPQGSVGPFWVTMRRSPFLFPTMSPWFIIPNYLTVREVDDIEKARCNFCRSPTIMLTGLPDGHYKHEDVAKLVFWSFPRENLRSLTVLPLQKRAFVHFDDWNKCSEFVREHIRKPVSLNRFKLSVHFVQHMKFAFTEETMYKNLMELSNAGSPESESLEERLLCVEIDEASVVIIRMVMEVVASIAPFVSFLPLANRICVEMRDSCGATQVLEKYKTFSPDSPKQQKTWSKVLRFENLKSLKQRLDDSNERSVNFGPDSINVGARPELSDQGSNSALQTGGPGGSTMSEPVKEGPSAPAASDVAMTEDGEKPGTEIAMDSTVGPDEVIEKIKREEESVTTSVSAADVTSASAVDSENTVPAASSPAPSATVSEENMSEPPQINTDMSNVLTAAAHQRRLTRGSSSQSEKKEGQDVFFEDIVSSDSSHDFYFNMDDFVTVDEVGDDAEDTRPHSRSQSDTATPEEEREQKSVKKNSTTDDMSDEEDYTDNTTKEEELTKEKMFTKRQEAKMTREKSSRSAQHKHDDGTEESVNFVTVDEVEEPEVQKTEVEAARQADVNAASAGLQPENPENPENQTLEGCVEGGEEEKEGRSRTDIKAVSKLRREPAGPEAKRSRSQSPRAAASTFKLPPFKPNNPLGLEFVVPKSGYFCDLCSVFYLNESTAKDVHCSSQRHHDNLQKHYQKLKQKTSGSSTQSSQGSVSD